MGRVTAKVYVRGHHMFGPDRGDWDLDRAVGEGLRVFDGVPDLAVEPVTARITPHVTHLTYRRA